MFAHFSSQTMPHKILLIRFGTVRDIVRTLPVVNILRIRYPFAKIAWFATGEMVDFLNNYNVADHIILAKPGWQKNLHEIKALRKRLRNFAPDLCLDFQVDLTSRFAARLSGSHRSLSLSGGKRRIFGNLKKLQPSPLKGTENYLQMLESLDIAGASVDYDLPIIPIESHTVGWIVRELGLESTPFAILGAGVQSSSTYWETSRYVQVARHLSRTLDLPTIVGWQTEQEKQLAETIVAESGGMVMTCPAISATQFAALARRAAIYVGVDNDLTYIAAATGTPTIGVFRDAESQGNAPCCENFQRVRSQTTQSRMRFGKSVETVPIRIDNYTYDVIKVCNACDEILQPVVETLLPEHANVVGV